MEIRKPLTKANIFEKVNQFEIFATYCSPFKKLNTSFRSELRQDKYPTCSICKRGDALIYRDFSESRTLDCFGYIMEKYSVGFFEALEMINQDFRLKLFSDVKLPHTSARIIQRVDFNIDDIEDQLIDIKVCVRSWTLADKEYWNTKYSLTQVTLKKYHVYPLSGFYINNSYTECGSNVYGYYFGTYPDGREAWKIYQPYAEKRFKWRSNCLENIFQGWDQLPETDDLIIVTKSLKDVMVLNQLGFSAIAPQAESIFISPELVLALEQKAKHIMILYDNDIPGKKAAEQIAEQYNVPLVFMPEPCKDASDFVELYGLTELLYYVTEQYEIHCNNSQLGSNVS